MARAKKTSKKEEAPKKTPTRTKASRKKKSENTFQSYYSAAGSNISKNRTLYLRLLVALLIIVALGATLVIKKNWFVAAVVNNQPISTLEYYQNLKEKDSKQVLNQIVQDKLITQEANRKGIVIAQSDLDKKTSDIEKQVGGKDQLKQELQSRNISEAEFKNQIRIQLMVEKLLADKIKISDKEIEDFVAKNKDNNLTGVDLSNKDAVRNQLQNDKLNSQFQSWYQGLEKNAKIYIFI